LIKTRNEVAARARQGSLGFGSHLLISQCDLFFSLQFQPWL